MSGKEQEPSKRPRQNQSISCLWVNGKYRIMVRVNHQQPWFDGASIQCERGWNQKAQSIANHGVVIKRIAIIRQYRTIPCVLINCNNGAQARVRYQCTNIIRVAVIQNNGLW